MSEQASTEQRAGGPATDWPANALAGSKLAPLWLDSADRPQPRPSLDGDHETDLLVVGGGFTGLWAALRAAERNPGRSVVIIEADRIAEHASGRNGGFCEASITHGELNGRSRWPDDYEQLHRLGIENLDGIEATIDRYGIDCGFTRKGILTVATRPHEVASLEPDEPGFLNASAVRTVVNSPSYLAGRLDEDETALVDPARLAWGLAAACEQHGVRIAEHTALVSLETRSGEVVARTTNGKVRAKGVVLATNAFPNPLRRLRRFVVPVYDYVLATEPLTDKQVATLNWEPGVGVSDSGNQFHYYRMTDDRRILWGGYDAIYHFGRSIDTSHDDREKTFAILARNFALTFPQLRGVRFTHRWSGVIDTSTRFCAFFGRAHKGRVAYATGFTGLGVGASRFAADVVLDLLDGSETERTKLPMVQETPTPFPPEPFAWIGIQITRWALAREDKTGHRNLWLRVLDRFGLGFDS